MFNYSVDELVQKAYKDKEFMIVFNNLKLPITLLGQTYRGYLIKEYLDSGIDSGEHG